MYANAKYVLNKFRLNGWSAKTKQYEYEGNQLQKKICNVSKALKLEVTQSALKGQASSLRIMEDVGKHLNPYNSRWKKPLLHKIRSYLKYFSCIAVKQTPSWSVNLFICFYYFVCMVYYILYRSMLFIIHVISIKTKVLLLHA